MLDSRSVVAQTCIHHKDTKPFNSTLPMLHHSHAWGEHASGDGQTSAERIAFSVLRAIAGQRLRPGTRLTEEDLATVFGVSRTVVRQALTLLAAHGIVGVRPKKGWFIIEPPEREIRDVFAARRLLEGALIREFAAAATPAQIRALQEHVHQQRHAIDGDDAALRTHLLTDFHVQIAEVMGNAVVARMVRDLTMRTNLITMLYQTGQDASASCAEHGEVLEAVKARDGASAARLMGKHLSAVERGLRNRRSADPIDRLRDALTTPSDAPAAPIGAAAASAGAAPNARRRAPTKARLPSAK
jgi:DNA-binding GntR family transcriptional regulator